MITLEEFKAAKQIKHPADIDCGDILLLDDGNGFHFEEKTFKEVVCTGYCGRDEFYGKETETGRRIGFCNGDLFKIIGKQIELNKTVNQLTSKQYDDTGNASFV